MEMKPLIAKGRDVISKYKYAFIILLVGLALLMIPEIKENKTEPKTTVQEIPSQMIDTQMLSEILQTVEGAGRVQVMLSLSSGEKTLYKTNAEQSRTGDNASNKTETVIITDSQRNESGLVTQIDAPTYKGAIVVCQGADSPTVRLAVTQAVSRITGLGADNICVLKMK